MQTTVLAAELCRDILSEAYIVVLGGLVKINKQLCF